MRAVGEEEFVRVGEAGGDFADLVGVDGAVGGEAVEAEDAEFVCHGDSCLFVGDFFFWMKFRLRKGMWLHEPKSMIVKK